MPTRALVFEQYASAGHTLYWVRLVVQALAGLFDEVLVAIPADAVGTPQYRQSLQDLEGQFRHVDCPASRPAGRIDMIRDLSALVERLVDEHKPDALYVPTGDGFVDAVNLARLLGKRAVRRVSHSEVLLMRRSGAYGVPDPRVPAWVGNLAIRLGDWSRIHTIDPVILNWLRTRCGRRIAARSDLSPDPIESPPPLTRHVARSKTGLPADGRILSCLGMNDARKGVDLLLAAFPLASRAKDDRLLLAGPLSAGMGAAITEARRILGDSLVVVDRYLSHDQLHEFACASDVVAVPYRSVAQPSGVCIRALAAGRPVLSNQGGWFSNMVPRFGLGHTCDVTDTAAFARAITAALDEAAAYTVTAAGHRLLEYQRPENFSAAWRVGWAEKVGAAPMPTRTWDWVLQATLPTPRT